MDFENVECGSKSEHIAGATTGPGGLKIDPLLT